MNGTMIITESKRWTIINGLRLAAQEYRDIAIKMNVVDEPRLVEQFEKQAKDADDLAVEIEAAEDFV